MPRTSTRRGGLVKGERTYPARPGTAWAVIRASLCSCEGGGTETVLGAGLGEVVCAMGCDAGAEFWATWGAVFRAASPAGEDCCCRLLIT